MKRKRKSEEKRKERGRRMLRNINQKVLKEKFGEKKSHGDIVEERERK